MKTLKTESKRQKRSVLSILHRDNTLIRELKYILSLAGYPYSKELYFRQTQLDGMLIKDIN